MILRVKLAKPTGGYWDGGEKSIFHWFIDGIPQADAKGQYVKVGSWSANNWFHIAVGKTEKATLGNARRRLVNILKRKGIEAKFSYIKEAGC